MNRSTISGLVQATAVGYSPCMMLYRAFATVGGLTMISRILGFIRDILIASALGTGFIADAFFVAFRFPNLFRRLFGEGAFNAAFVPLFARRLEKEGDEKAWRFAENAMSGLGFVLLIFSATTMLAMPWAMLLMAPGFTSEPDKFDLAVALTRIAFPYLLCMSLVALLSGVLNTYNRFWAAAAAPILLNIILILSIVAAITTGQANRIGAGFILATGVTVAGFAQLAMLWYAVRRAGIRLSFRLPRYDDGMKRLVELGIPGVISGGITQINIVIGTIIASMQTGAVSFLYYADRLYQLPLGIVGIAIGVVLLPDLSRKLRAGEIRAAHEAQNRSMEFALLLTLPAAIALAIAAKPIIGVLFERGAFTEADTAATAQALVAFALGLPAFVLIKVFQPAFFAREDTKTPMWFAGISVIVNVVGSLILFYSFKSQGWMPHVGIALATSLAGWINALLLWGVLARQRAFVWDRKLAWNFLAILIASLLMGAGLLYTLPYIQPFISASAPLTTRIAGLAIMVAGGAAVFGIVLAFIGQFQFRRLLRKPASKT